MACASAGYDKSRNKVSSSICQELWISAWSAISISCAAWSEQAQAAARIPVAWSQGFNPRPKVVFALALGLGIEGLREVVDLELSEPLDPLELLPRLAAEAPAGFEWIDARPLSV